MLLAKLQQSGQRYDPFATSPSAHETTEVASDAEAHHYSMAMDDPSLVDCFVHLPSLGTIPLPLSYEVCATAQNQDPQLLQKVIDEPQRYVCQQLAPNANLICYIPAPGEPWKICLPLHKLPDTVQWYHIHLGHPEISRTFETIRLHFYHPQLRSYCKQHITRCDACQHNKHLTKGYGKLPPRQAVASAWQEVACNLIGPWRLPVQNHTYTFHALTMIDTVTNFPEVTWIDNKSTAPVGQKFENEWLSRYPRPMVCIYDQGNKFLGFCFQQVLHQYNITPRVLTVKNPQSNAVLERLHQTISSTLRTRIHANPPADQLQAELLVDTVLQHAAYAVRATIHTTLEATPGSLVFHRDMILNIPMVADLIDITSRRQQLIDQQTIEENCKRIMHDYQPNDGVLVLAYKPDKELPDHTASCTRTLTAPSRYNEVPRSRSASTYVASARIDDQGFLLCIRFPHLKASIHSL
ncbi:hypothetical protein ACA910_007210 [Epithemia clementina (nom. ined.)]